MGATWGRRVVEATSQFHEMAEGLADRRWEARAGGLEWSCNETAHEEFTDAHRAAVSDADTDVGCPVLT